MMALTKEQRAAAAKQRAAEKQERAKRLPGARLDWTVMPESGVTVELLEGLPFMRVSKRGKWWPSRELPDTWTYQDIRLDDLLAIAPFIHALAARYNELVREINLAAAGSDLEPVCEIESDTVSGA